MKACELVGVSRHTIYNWLSSGKIEYVRTAGASGAHIRRHALARPEQDRSSGDAGDVAGRRPQSGVTASRCSVEELLARKSMDEAPELRLLFTD